MSQIRISDDHSVTPPESLAEASTERETVNTPLGRALFYALVLLGVYLSYLILSPFFVALTWAALFAILFRRVQVVLTSKIGQNGAALVTTVLVGVLIVAPAFALISALAREAPGVADYVRHASDSTPRQLRQIWETIRARSPVSIPEDPTVFVLSGTQRVVEFLAPQAGAVLVNVFATLANLAVMLFALFFMLRDGATWRRSLRNRLPFTEEEGERLMAETRDLVIAGVGASLVVAAAQGAIGGLAFWLLGIGAPVFWGMAMAFGSLLPLGAALVWFPAAVWLLLSGDVGRGVILLVVGTFGISLVDNILRPVLLSGKTSVSGLVIFFGLLGGAAAFGFVGLVIGPIILVTTFRLLELLHRPLLPSRGTR
jgi:predicted PurR-regulated permease PerM